MDMLSIHTIQVALMFYACFLYYLFFSTLPLSFSLHSNYTCAPLRLN